MVNYPILRNMKLFIDSAPQGDHYIPVAKFDIRLSQDIAVRDAELCANALGLYYTRFRSVPARGARMTFRDGALKDKITETAAHMYEAMIGGAH